MTRVIDVIAGAPSARTPRGFAFTRRLGVLFRRWRTHALGTRQTIHLVQLHGIDLPTFHAAARRGKWLDFTPPAAGLSRRAPVKECSLISPARGAHSIPWSNFAPMLSGRRLEHFDGF